MTHFPMAGRWRDCGDRYGAMELGWRSFWIGGIFCTEYRIWSARRKRYVLFVSIKDAVMPGNWAAASQAPSVTVRYAI